MNTEVVGTPLYMAPEILHCQPLDQRSDLFALGAVMYWALTATNAYSAQHVTELPDRWLTPPAPPSELVSGIPQALDALVLSLLSIDSMARPASAASVIDQLTVIGELPPEEHEQAAEHYLCSSRMVGRGAEIGFVRRLFERLFRGRGAEVVIDGAAGIGKPRLLQEIGLEGKLKGLMVLEHQPFLDVIAGGLADLLVKTEISV